MESVWKVYGNYIGSTAHTLLLSTGDVYERPP